jgi:hypothetical protein
MPENEAGQRGVAPVRMGWAGRGRPALEKSESEGGHGGRSEAEHQTEDADELEGVAHGILGLRLLFKRGFIAEIGGGSGTLVK